MNKTNFSCKHENVTLWVELKAEKLDQCERLIFAGCQDCEKKKKITKTLIRELIKNGL